MSFEYKIELIGGYTSTDPKTKEKAHHTEVVFGKRLTAKDLMDLDNDPQAQNPTQYQDLIRRKMITRFGDLNIPVALNVLLSLDSIDRDDLASAANRFLEISRGDAPGEFRDNHEVKLHFGFDIDGTFYNIVRFGNRITGKDDVEADVFGNGTARMCFLTGRQISHLSTSDGTASINGTVALENFSSLDAEDLNLLRMGAELWRVSFRFGRKNIPTKRTGDSGISDSARDENVGNGDSQSSDGTN